MPKVISQLSNPNFWLFVVGCALSLASIYFSGLLFWTPNISPESILNFIDRFQIIISGFSALIAGSFVWLNGKSERKHQKSKDLDNYYIKKASIASAFQAEFTNIKTQEDRLQILSVLKKQQKDIELAISKKQTFYQLEGSRFFFKDEILPIYYRNANKIGLLDPNVAKLVVITASLIISAIRQIELVSEKNLKNESLPIKEANYIIFLAITSVSQALSSIDICNKVLKEVIDVNYSRLSSVRDYF